MLERIGHRIRFWRDHRWVPERSSDYLDGELDEHDSARAERHLAGCPECQALVDGLRAIVDALGAIGTESSEPVADAVLASLQGQLAELPADSA